MDEWIRFNPPRRRGTMLHVAALLLLSAAIGSMLTVASNSPAGLLAVLLLVGSVLLSILLPILLYRLYALLQSGYWIGEGGLRLQWGLRQVYLPNEVILDIALADELEALPARPRWCWPGNVSGVVEDEELGTVEYLAAQSEGLVFLGTKERVFVLSPNQAQDFLTIFRREAERGSLVEVEAYSIWPRFLLAQAWAETPIRLLLVAGAGMAVALLVLVGVLAPGRESISLGFGPSGEGLEAVPGIQLFLLPALNAFFYIGNLLLGLIVYREKKQALLAKMIWGSSLVSGFLFLGAVLVILLKAR